MPDVARALREEMPPWVYYQMGVVRDLTKQLSTHLEVMSNIGVSSKDLSQSTKILTSAVQELKDAATVLNGNNRLRKNGGAGK